MMTLSLDVLPFNILIFSALTSSSYTSYLMSKQWRILNLVTKLPLPNHKIHQKFLFRSFFSINTLYKECKIFATQKQT